MTQERALSILKTGANVFLTGTPGSGKTHTVNAYVAWLRAHQIEPAITASTGIAATHLSGQTIHSWSGIGIADSLTPELLDRITSKEHVAKRIQRTPVLIIDEVSMLSGEVLSMVDRVCREVRRSERAFGGMQVVLVGDFFQLPPVAGRGSTPSFAFQSDAWRALNPIVCYLVEQHRQEDKKLTSVLDAVRDGSWDASHVSTVLSRESEEGDVEEEIPRLYTHNEDVDRINNEKLTRLKGEPKSFRMSESGSETLTASLKRGCLSPETLLLKEGALVMCTKNNPAAGYANGTLGQVVRFEAVTGNPVVETVAGDLITLTPVEWAVEENGKVRARITQVPLRLAWAITVHKSQGMSLDRAAVDLARVFEHGQGYVALSRLRALSGLYLLGWSENAFSVHPEVSALDAQLRDASEEAARMFEALTETGEREVMEHAFITASGGSIEELSRPAAREKGAIYEETVALLREGKDAREIARARGRTLGTIASHIEKAIAAGALSREEALEALPATLRPALPKIFAAIKKSGGTSLTLIHTLLKKGYTFDELRLARAVYAG